jgi:hypothetical protein
MVGCNKLLFLFYFIVVSKFYYQIVVFFIIKKFLLLVTWFLLKSELKIGVSGKIINHFILPVVVLWGPIQTFLQVCNIFG